MNKWKWVKDEDFYYDTGETQRLYRFKEVDYIPVISNYPYKTSYDISVFQFQLMNHNTELTSGCIEQYEWLKDAYIVVHGTDAESQAMRIYNHIEKTQYDYCVNLDWGINSEGSGTDLLFETHILDKEDLELHYLNISYEIIHNQKNNANISDGAVSYDWIFESLSKSGAWDLLIKINRKYSGCLAPTSLLKTIKEFSRDSLEITLDDYNATDSYDSVSCLLVEYRQHQENHRLLSKMLFLYDFMSYDSNWDLLYNTSD